MTFVVIFVVFFSFTHAMQKSASFPQESQKKMLITTTRRSTSEPTVKAQRQSSLRKITFEDKDIQEFGKARVSKDNKASDNTSI